MPEPGDETVVRHRRPPSAEPLPELDLIEEPEPGRSRGARPAMVLALCTVAFGSVLYSSAFWREQLAAALRMAVPPRASSPEPPPARVVAPATPSPAAEVARADWAGLAATAEPLGPLPSLRPDPPAPAPPRDTPRQATSRLSIGLEHGLESGRVRVLVDGQAVLDQKLTGRVKRNLLLFKVRSGSVQDVLPVAPGRRLVRVEVSAGGATRAREITGTFRTGATRRLVVEVGKKGEPSLAWK